MITMGRNIRDIRNIIYSSLEDGTLGRALAQLGLIAKGEQNEQLGNIRQSYDLMLRYMFDGVDDPERDQIFSHLIKQTFELTDDICATYMSAETPVNKVFTYLWSPPRFEQEHIDYCDAIMASDNMIDCCMAVSATTISCLRIFDENKFHTLVRFCKSSQHEASLRAVTGIMLCLIRHHKRIGQYPSITNSLNLLFDGEEIVGKARTVILQFIRCKETLRITKDITDNIIPTLTKIAPDIQEKTKDMKFDSDEFEENIYHLQDLLAENGLSDKMQNYSELQLQGSDINYSSFSMLKTFSFFDKIDNWFMPFYKENPAVSALYEDESSEGNVISNLLDNRFICDSDKYSFCVNIAQLSKELRMSMATQLKLENEQSAGMKSMADDNDTDYMNRYMQDIFRFYKLYRNHNDFNDIFEYEADIHRMPFFRFVNQDNAFLEQMADYLLSKEQYAAALSAYVMYDSMEEHSAVRFCKMGFCEMKRHNWHKAIEYYNKADIMESDNPDIIRKLAYCCRMSGNYGKALEYYLLINGEDGDDLNVLFNIGQCYCELRNFELAMRYFTKIDFLNNNVKRSYRFHLYHGHCLWATGQKKEAIKRYMMFEPKKELENELRNSPLDLSDRDLVYITDYIRYNR